MFLNSIGLLVNFADIFYYPYKQSRLVLGDILLVKEDSFSLLLVDIIADYWYGFVFIFLSLPFCILDTSALATINQIYLKIGVIT